MKTLISFIILFMPLTVLAHPGHGIEEQMHGFIHIEHLILIVAVAAVVIFNKITK